MILVCPNCIARYRVEVEALGAMGRRVRCSKCRHVWHAEPPERIVEVIHAAPEAMPPEPQPAPRRVQLPVPAGAVRPQQNRSLWTWIVCLLFLAVCVVGYEAREAIVTEWPGLSVLYDALGIALAPRS